MRKAFFSVFVVFLLSVVTEAQTHKGISFQGVIKLPSGELPTRSGVTVNARILSSNDCILREEQFTGVNISNGYINLALGTGAAGGSDPGFTLKQVMDNSATISGLVCLLVDGTVNGSVTSFNPATSNGVRKFRLSLTIDSLPVVADFNMRSMAYAVNAESLDGKVKSDFININVGQSLTQANAESIFNRYTKLDAILGNFNAGGNSLSGSVSGTAANVTGVVAVANGGTGASSAASARTNLGLGNLATVSLPSPLDASKVLVGDGTWAALPSGGGSGTVTSITAGTGLIHVTSAGNPLTTAGELAVNVGTGNNQIVQLDGTGKLPPLDGSSLTNVTASALTNTAAINTSGNIVTSGNIQAGTSVTAKNIYIYDNAGTPASVGLRAPADMVAAGGASYVLTLPEKKGTIGQVLAAKDGNGVLEWISTAGGTISAVTADTPLVVDNSVAGSPKVTLPKANTSTSGYLDSADWNTFNGKQAAGNYITTLTGDVSSSLFTTGSVTTSVDKLKGVAVSTAVAGDDQKFMKYVHGSGWQPQFVKLSELRNAVGTGSAFNVGACTAAQTLVWSSLTDQFSCQNITLPSGQITGLATVATSGSYNDLADKPTLGSLGAKSSVDLSTSDVTGTLPVSRGGTNSTTALNNNRVMISSSGAIVENPAITVSRALASDANGLPVASATTSAELGYLAGVTSAVQTQLNAKAALGGWSNYSVIGTNGSGAMTAVTGSVTGSVLQYSGTGAFYSAASYPSSTTAGQLLYSSANNVVGGLATANNAILTTNGSGIPSWSVLSNDVFTQYIRLVGRAGGQDVKGGTAASENLTLDSTSHTTKGYVLLNPTGGNVGVGTTTPISRLQVNGAVDGSFGPANGVMATGGSWPTAVSNIYLAYGGKYSTNSILGSQFGILGVNVTYNATTDTLERQGAESSRDSAMAITMNPYSSQSGGYRMGFWTGNGTNPTERLSITGSGSVGIGNSAPNAKLDVMGSGTGAAVATTGSSDTTTNFRAGRGSVGVDVGMLDNGTGYVQNRSIANFATTYNLAIQPTGGNVGIGISSPNAKLDVNGVINVNNNKITNVATPTAATDVATKAYVDAAMSSSGISMISSESGSTYAFGNAIAYCRSLNAACQYKVDGSACDATTYTGWRVPKYEELVLFVGLSASTTFLHSTTPNIADTGGYLFIARLSDGYTSASATSTARALRCVR